MPNLTINTRPMPLASCTEEIEHDCPGCRIHSQRPKMPNRSLIQMNNRKYLTLMVFATILALTPSGNLHANRKSSDPNPRPTDLKAWKTNTVKRTIELNELISGGRAIQGEPKGKNSHPVVHGDYFAFAWLVFKTETKIYTGQYGPGWPLLRQNRP
jgi:hypothetical protein